MSSIDNRVVQMEFENREFEKGVEESKKSLDSLDEKLNTVGSEGGEGILASLKKVDEGVEQTTQTFSAFEQITAGIFLSLGAKIADFGINLVESLSIDQIAEGYSKYENIISSMAGLINTAEYQGHDYGDVEHALDQLTWYADTTSYSLEAMQSALLSFMNSNIDMDTAVQMIMGMGNAFSYAGATATEMDGAFSMMSKAAGSYMTLMQWNSLERVYKVITPKLIDQFIEAGIAEETIVKVSDDLYRTTDKAMSTTGKAVEFSRDQFRNSLKGGWITAKVMQNIYGNYGAYAQKVYDLQQKLAEEGNFVNVEDAMAAVNEEFYNSADALDEAKSALFEFQKRAYESAQEAKVWSEVVDALKDAVSTSWMKMFTAVIGDYYEAKALMSSMFDFFDRKISSPIAALADLATEWKKLGGRGPLLEALGNLVNTFDNLATSAKDALTSFIPPMTAQTLVDITKKFRDFTEKIFISKERAEELVKPLGIISLVIKSIGKAIQAVWKLITSTYEAFKPVIDAIGTALYYVAGGIYTVLNFVTQLGILDNMATQLSYTFTNVKKKLEDWYIGFTDGRSVVDAVLEEFTDLEFGSEDLKKAFEGLKNYLSDFWKALNDGVDGELEKFKTKFIDKIKTAITTGIGWIVTGGKWVIDNISTIWNYIKDFFSNVEKYVDKVVTKLNDIYVRLFKSADDVAGESASLFQQYMNKINQGETLLDRILFIFDKVVGAIGGLFKLDIIANIAGIMRNLTKITKTARDFISPLEELTKTLKTMTKSIKVNILKKIATSVVLLAGAMLILSLIPSDKIKEAIGSLVVVMGTIAGMIFVINKTNDQFSTASKSITALGIAVFLISLAMTRLTEAAKSPEFGSAFGAVTMMMGMIMLLIYMLSKIQADNKALNSSADVGLMLLKLASGLLIISKAMTALADTDPVSLGIGLATILILIFSMSKFIKSFAGIDNKMGDNAKQAGTAMVALSVGLIFMAGAVKAFGAIPIPELIKGLITVELLLLAVSDVSWRMKSQGKQMTALAGSLIIIAIAMQAMALAFIAFNFIKIEAWATGIITIVTLLAGLSFFSYTINPAQVLALAGSVAILGLGMIALAAGLNALGLVPIFFALKGLTAFAIIVGILAAAAPALKTAGTAMLTFAGSLATLGLALIAIAAGITLLTGVLALINGELLAKKITEIIVALCAAIVSSVDAIIEAIVALVLGVVKGIIDILVGVWDMIKPAISGIFGFLCDALGIEYTDDTLSAVGQMFYKVFGFIFEKIGELFPWLISLIASGIVTFLTWFSGKFYDFGVWIRTKIDEVWAKMKDGLNNAIKGVKEAGANIIKGLKDGITNAITSSGIYQTVTNLGSTVIDKFKSVLGIHSPSKVFASAGNYIVEGLVNGIKDKMPDAENTSAAMGTGVIQSLKDAISGNIVDGVDTSLTLTPVLDLSEIENGISDMNGMLDTSNLTTSVGLMGDIQNPEYATASQLAGLRSDLGTYNASSVSTPTDIAGSIKQALEGVGIYADGKKIGKLVTIYQANTSRAGGY